MAESENTKNVTINVGAKDTTGDTFKKVADKAKKELGRLDQLKDVLGEESPFGKAMKSLRGTGAVAGLALAGRTLSDVTGKAVELRAALADGAGAGEIAAELLKSIPIIKDFATAGQNIRELFTGEREEIERITKEAESTNRYVESRRKAEQSTRDILRQQADIYAELRGDFELVGMTGAARTAAMNKRAAESDFKKYREDAEAAKAKEGGALDAAEKELIGKISAAQSGKGRPGYNPFDPQGSREAQRAFDAQQADEVASLNKQLAGVRQQKQAYAGRIDAGTQMLITGRAQVRDRQDAETFRKEAAEQAEKQREQEEERAKAEAEARKAAEDRKEQADREEADRRRVVKEFAASGNKAAAGLLGALMGTESKSVFGGRWNEVAGAVERAQKAVTTESPDVVKAIIDLGRQMDRNRPAVFDG